MPASPTGVSRRGKRACFGSRQARFESSHPDHGCVAQTWQERLVETQEAVRSNRTAVTTWSRPHGWDHAGVRGRP